MSGFLPKIVKSLGNTWKCLIAPFSTGAPAIAPLVSGITPNTGFVVGGNSITNLAGTGFVNGCTVTIGGIVATSVIFISSIKLTCISPNVGTSGAKNVVVTNPDTQTSGTSGNGLFTAIAAPTVSTITPTNGKLSAGTSITDLHGTNFINGATVTIGGTPATNVTWISATQITCTAPAGLAGVQDVIVTNPDTQVSTGGTGLYTYNAIPTISSITPNSGAVVGNTSITNLAGTGFISGCTITIGGASATNVAFISNIKLTCTSPAGSIGAQDVIVTNPDTQSSTGGTGLFTYTDANTYLTSGTAAIFTVPTTGTYIVHMIGGGGGGGDNTGGIGANGAGGGAYQKLTVSATAGNTWTYTIGALAPRNTNGNNTTITIGGATYTAGGGLKGQFGSASAGGIASGSGGTGVTVNLTRTGGAGAAGATGGGGGGAGAPSGIGRQGGAGYTTTNAIYGGGGGGAGNVSASVGAAASIAGSGAGGNGPSGTGAGSSGGTALAGGTGVATTGAGGGGSGGEYGGVNGGAGATGSDITAIPVYGAGGGGGGAGATFDIQDPDTLEWTYTTAASGGNGGNYGGGGGGTGNYQNVRPFGGVGAQGVIVIIPQ